MWEVRSLISVGNEGHKWTHSKLLGQAFQTFGLSAHAFSQLSIWEWPTFQSEAQTGEGREAHMPCPALPSTAHLSWDLQAKINGRTFNECGTHAAWGCFPKSAPSPPFPLEGSAWELTQCLHSVMT